MTTCCVLGCYDQGKFRLPFDNPAIYNKWLISCPYLKESSGRELENKRICSKHFIPEHLQIFPNNVKDRLTTDAVPLLYLHKYLNDECEEVKEEDDEEGIETIEDVIDPSLYSMSVNDETLHYDSMECISLQQPEETEIDPLKSSPVDFIDDQLSVIALSPDPDDVVMAVPETEHVESPPIIKPKPIKVPTVVLHRLPSIFQKGKKFKISPMPPPLKPKPKLTPIAPKILNIGLGSPAASAGTSVPPRRFPILRRKIPRLKTNQDNLQNQSELSLERIINVKSSTGEKQISLKFHYNKRQNTAELTLEKEHGLSNTIGKKVSEPLTETNNADGVKTVTNNNADCAQTVTNNNADGVQTVTNNNADGVQTVTNNNADGVQTVTNNNADGVQTVTNNNADGVQTVTKNNSDGVQTVTNNNSDGVQTETNNNADGVQTVTNTNADGVQTVTNTNADVRPSVWTPTVGRTSTYKPGINYPKMKSYLEKEQDSWSRFGLTFTMDTNNIRYTTKEKVFALSLLKLSPKLILDYLRKEITALPSKEMINTLLNHVPLWPGINQFIFQHLGDAAAHKINRHKECVLLFREMAVEEFLHFNTETGIIDGYQDLGSGKRGNLAGNKVLVFLLCGLFQFWKLPIAYYITGSLIEHNNGIFKSILSEVLKAVFDTGFVVKATISDHNSTIDEAIKSFKADIGLSEYKIYYKIGNKHIFHIFDVTNILECLKKDSKDALDWDLLKTLFLLDNVERGDETNAEDNKLEDTEGKNTEVEQSWFWDKQTDEVKFWETSLTQLQAMRLKLEDGQTEHLPIVNIIINNVKSIKKLCEDTQPRVTPILRLDLTALNFLLRKIQNTEQKIKSFEFITKYKSLLLNTLTSDRSLCTGFATFQYHSSKYDDKIVGVLKNFISPKNYGPYYEDVDLENVVYYVEKVPTKGGNWQAFKTIVDSYDPLKDCGMCLNSITTGIGMDVAISNSEKIINTIIPKMVNNNCQMYHLSLILQQQVDSSWFICGTHKGLFFKILWAFLIKNGASKWCSSFNMKLEARSIISSKNP